MHMCMLSPVDGVERVETDDVEDGDEVGPCHGRFVIDGEEFSGVCDDEMT